MRVPLGLFFWVSNDYTGPPIEVNLLWIADLWYIFGAMTYLSDLNNEQKRAVLHKDGPLLILAGAGAGKTRVITYRIAHLIKHGVHPEQILAVTFTNKAAKEMQERINHLLAHDAQFAMPVEVRERPFVRTFHSLGVHIIRENAELIGLPKRFSILDSSDAKKIIKEAMESAGYDTKEFEPRKIQSIISNQKGDLISIEDYETKAKNYSYLGDVVLKTWRLYEKRLNEEGALDFDDLLIKTVHILEKYPDVLARYQKRWNYIHIDEYQDTNEVQYNISKLLAKAHKNMCVVGDIDQNIYSWRGASIKNIMHFEKDYPGATEIILEENYRSTQNILQAANEIISKNVMRKEKNLFTKNGEGDKITVYNAIDEYDEAKFLVRKAKEAMASGVHPSDMAFLYRANFQSRVLEEICLQEQLPHQVIGTKFFDRKEVKDVIAYIKAALNGKDFTSISRIINVPKRGIGKVTLLKIAEGHEDDLTPAVYAKVQQFYNTLTEIGDVMRTKKPHEVVAHIMTATGMEAELQKDGEEGAERLENIRELVSLAKRYEDFAAEHSPAEAMDKLLEDMSLTSDQDELDKKEDGVKLMTVHAAKGLEFAHVFVTGLEAGLFPHEKFDAKGEEDAEEERRLFYVAVTRARKKLYLTHASFRTIYGSKEVNMASEFLEDISDKLIQKESFEDQYAREERGASSGGTKEYLIDF